MLASIVVRRSAIGFASLWIAANAASARAECRPAAVTAGDPALVQRLTARLAASGIATTAAAGCPAVQVTIEQRGDELHLALLDAFQRKGERDVRDVNTAAAIVASWTEQVVDAGVLPAEPAPPEPAVAATVSASPRPTIPRAVYRGLAASALSTVGTDGTTWVGTALAACTRAGPFCAGASLRAEVDTTATGATAQAAQDSYELSALATLDLPRALGRFIVSPGIGVGYGYLHVTTHHHDAMNNPLDIASADHELRAGAHVALLRPIGAHWSVFGDLWGEVAPLRSSSQFGSTAAALLAFGIRLEAP